MVPMDARLIGQVLTNLLDNAVKHTQPEEEISVTVSRATEQQAVVLRLLTGDAALRLRICPTSFRCFTPQKEKARMPSAVLDLALRSANPS